MTPTETVIAISVLLGAGLVLGAQLLVLRRLRATAPPRRPGAGSRPGTRSAPGGRGARAVRRSDLSRLARQLRTEADLLQRRTVRELEALIDLRALVASRTTMPSTQGWAAGPVTISVLVREVLDSKPALSLEAGSGVSSVWVGYCLERNGGGRCISLDHEESYAEITRAELRRHGLEHYVDVRVCPLVEQAIGEERFRWYDLTGMDDLTGIEFVFVDGPPGTTGPLARYPALPLLRQHCAPGARFLLDDAGRKNESAVLERWRTEFGATPSPVTRHLDACELLYLPG